MKCPICNQYEIDLGQLFERYDECVPLNKYHKDRAFGEALRKGLNNGGIIIHSEGSIDERESSDGRTQR